MNSNFSLSALGGKALQMQTKQEMIKMHSMVPILERKPSW